MFVITFNISYVSRSNSELQIVPTKSNWNTGQRYKTLSTLYKNQRRYAVRKGWDWWEHTEWDRMLFRDTVEEVSDDDDECIWGDS